MIAKEATTEQHETLDPAWRNNLKQRTANPRDVRIEVAEGAALATGEVTEYRYVSLTDYERLRAENERLRAQLKRVEQHYEVRSEIHTNDSDLAATMYDIARAAPEQRTEGQ